MLNFQKISAWKLSTGTLIGFYYKEKIIIGHTPYRSEKKKTIQNISDHCFVKLC